MKKLICTLFLLACGFFTAASPSDGNVVSTSGQLQAAALRTPIEEGNDLYGLIVDTEGAPVEGVVVSDGFTCVASDANGIYQMARNKDAFHVYYRIPADREVPMTDGRPCFWQRLSDNRQRYDFTLGARQPVETHFTLFCLADPQTRDAEQFNRFVSESVPDIREHAAECTPPVYGITLGDVISNHKTKYVTPVILPLMVQVLREEQIGMPLFQVVGNHDMATRPEPFKGSSTYDLAARRDFEAAFGPCDYSFERGDAHIVGMDNVLLLDETHNPSNYERGFTADQLEWLRQDLELADKEKLIIFCTHVALDMIPADQKETVLGLLGQFSEAHIMSGHSHRNRNYFHTAGDSGRTIYEHNHGAVCGAHWRSTICAEGTPNGYGVFEIGGSTFTNWYYKSVRYDKDFQIRMYRANTRFAYDKRPQFMYHDDDGIVANIWNSDEKNWTVEVFENGVKTGEMIRFRDFDAWASGYLAGILGRETYPKRTDHLYYYTLKDANAAVEIRATDPFGNIYTQDTFTTNSTTEYPTVENYPKR